MPSLAMREYCFLRLMDIICSYSSTIPFSLKEFVVRDFT